MDNLIFDGGDNMGGARHFRFSPIENITALPDVFNGMVDEAIDFAGSNDWFQGYVTEDTADFNEGGKQGPGGPILEPEFNDFFPGDTPSVRRTMADLVRHRFVVDVTDNNGRVRRMGTLDNPVRFTTDYSTGRGATNRPGYAIKARWASPDPAPFVDTDSGSASF